MKRLTGYRSSTRTWWRRITRSRKKGR